MAKPRKKLNRLLLSAVALVASLVLGVSAAFAWFTLNEQRTISGVSFKTQNARIEFDGQITVRRGYAGRLEYETQTLYTRGGDGIYRTAEGELLSFSELLPPSEYIELDVTLKSTSLLDGQLFSLSLQGLSGKEFDYYLSGEVGGAISQASILGIYKASYKFSQNEEWQSKMIAPFSEQAATQLVLIENYAWPIGQTVVPLTIRLSFDLFEYRQLVTVEPEQIVLSEAEITIKQIYVTTSGAV